MSTLKDYVTSEEQSHLEWLYEAWDWFNEDGGYGFPVTPEGFDAYILQCEEEMMQYFINKFKE